MSCGNKYQTIDTIADWILKCLEGIKNGTHNYDFLDSEIYGCCEKIIEKEDEEKGKEKPAFSESNRIIIKRKKRAQVYIVKLSLNAEKKLSEKQIDINEKQKDINGKTYTILSKNDLKGLRSEHIYPRALLFRDFVEMENPSFNKIKDLINERCKCAYLTKEEEERLDRKLTKEDVEKLKENLSNEKIDDYEIQEGVSLKEKMPTCWKPGQPVEVRLSARGINLSEKPYLVADI